MENGLTSTDGLARSCAAIEQVCRLLGTPSPEVLDAAEGILAGVVDEVRRARRPGEDYGALRSLSRRARVLLEKASAYHAGWTARRAIRTGGYGPGGGAAASPARGRLSIEG